LYIIDKYPSKDIVGILAGMSAQLVISMIQLLPTHYVPKYQEAYNHIIENLNVHMLVCPKCSVRSGCTKHGYYTRSFLSREGKVPIRICRLKCESCGATHALLPLYIIPYSQVTFNDHLDIIESFDSGEDPREIEPANPEIPRWVIVYIIKQFIAFWSARIRTAGISFDHSRNDFIRACFKNYNCQFMQIKRTPNWLYLQPT